MRLVCSRVESVFKLARHQFRDSIQRTQCWWLPYLVMEYEVNQVLITPLGGELDKPLYMYQAHLCVPTFSRLFRLNDQHYSSSDVSRNSEISLQCYLRAEEPKCGGDGLADDLGNDVFLGGIKFVPNFDAMGSQDQWYNFVGGSGKIQIGVTYQPSYGQSLTVDDFELMTVIGKGSFGKVALSRYCVLTEPNASWCRLCKLGNEIQPVFTLSKPSGKSTSSTVTKLRIPSRNVLFWHKLTALS